MKEGFELFDLNGDKRADDHELRYFSSGGTIHRNGDEEITAEELCKSVANIDKFDNKATWFGNIFNKIKAKKDKTTNGKAEKKLYEVIEAGHFMADNLDQISPKVRDDYLKNLDGVDITGVHDKDTYGYMSATKSNDYEKLNVSQLGPGEIGTALTLMHEATHVIQHKKSLQEKLPEMPLMQMEAQAIYMESLFRDKVRDDVDNSRVTMFWEGIYDDAKRLSRNNTLTRAEAMESIVLNNDSLIEDYIKAWKKYAGIEYTRNDVEKMFDNPKYVSIGDMDFSRSGKNDFSEPEEPKWYAASNENSYWNSFGSGYWNSPDFSFIDMFSAGGFDLYGSGNIGFYPPPNMTLSEPTYRDVLLDMIFGYS